MVDWKQITTNTYNRNAKDFAEYFQGIGPRIEDIDRAFNLAGNQKNAKVVEIGCGDGRDAEEIVKRTKNYTGFDISEELIKLAKIRLSKTQFEVADATSYKYPASLDIVFAFASLLHLNKEDVKAVLNKVQIALKPGGIFYISLKYAPSYQNKLKKSWIGRRMFYLYNPKLIKKLAGSGYQSVYENKGTIGKTEWFEIALKKM